MTAIEGTNSGPSQTLLSTIPSVCSTACTGERRYRSSCHGTTVLSGFERLWQDAVMCDTKLVVQGEEFHVHRYFLAACSHYFCCMFTENYSESHQNSVELKGVTAVGLQAVLQYAYTGELVLSQGHLPDVLEAAAYLQFQEVIDFCAQYIKDQLTIDNCLQFLNMADMYEMRVSALDTKLFILQNFVAVAMREDFLDTSLDLLSELLADDRLMADSELDVFQVALKWLEGHPERAMESRRILGHIRFGLMTAEEMDSVYTHQLMLREDCRDVLQTAISYHMKLFLQPLTDNPIARMRAAVDCLVVLGAGKTDNHLSTDILAAQLSEHDDLDEFRNITPVKYQRYFAAVAVLNNFVFVVGGQTAMAGDGSHATNIAFRYNGRDDKWLQISSMRTPRTHFCLVALNDCLIAVGGKSNRLALSSVERYSFKNNEWTPVAQLPTTLFSHAGCCHNNQLYISGGCPGQDFTNQVHCYDPQRDAWQYKSHMIHSRGYHVMVTHADRILACAGNTNAGNRTDVLHAESYDIETDQWTVLSASLRGQSEAPAVTWRDRLYIVGGYSWNSHSFQRFIQAYDIREDRWRHLNSNMMLPEPMTGVVACYLQLPLRVFENAEFAEHPDVND